MNQLVMVRSSLAGLPELTPPAGFHIRSFEPGDEKDWENIIGSSFETPRTIKTVMADDPGFEPKRIFFAVCDDVPVATAAAWYHPLWGQEYGYLFFVAVTPEYRGRYLGYAVSLAALHRFVEEHREQAVLETDDHRIAAIKTYLRLGFHPHLTEETRLRWQSIDARYSLGLDIPGTEEWLSETAL